MIRLRPCAPRCAIAAGWSSSARSPSSGCTTSSTHFALACPRQRAMAVCWNLRIVPGRRCSPARSRSPAAPAARSLQARAPRRLFANNARYWAQRWGQCLPPPPDAAVRAERLGRSVARWQAIRADIAAVELDLEALLAATAGQVLTLPGVGVLRAAGFAAFSLPIERFPTAAHLYSATGLAPARYQSATINRTGRISRTGLPSTATR
jgi:transposase